MINIRAREKWKPITTIYHNGILYDIKPGYFISNHGRVKTSTGKFKSLTCTGKRYYTVALAVDKKKYGRYRIDVFVHRIVMEYFGEENIENKPTVNHKNGDRFDNYYKNLEWSTHKEQSYHSTYIIKHNFIPCGEKCGKAKTDNETIHKVCKLLEDGKITKDIVAELSLDNMEYWSNLITKIRLGTAWKSISSQYNIPKKFGSAYLDDNTVEAICKDIASGMHEKAVYLKFQTVFSSYSNPYAKFRDIIIKRAYKRISDKYF